MKKLLLLAGLLVLALCSGCELRTGWQERIQPTNEAERAAVAEHAERILAATPRQLAGHDQDWDDAIAMAHDQARKIICRPTYWEWKETRFGGAWEFTGRWRYAEQAQPEGRAQP